LPDALTERRRRRRARRPGPCVRRDLPRLAVSAGKGKLPGASAARVK
jgi:hypothetical protein